MLLFPDGCNYDIVVLTEFYRLKDFDIFNQQFKKWKYTTFISQDIEEHNNVFIAVKQCYKPEQFYIRLQVKNIFNKIIVNPVEILGVNIYTDEGKLSIIGLLLRSGFKKNQHVNKKDINDNMGIILKGLTDWLRVTYRTDEDKVIIAGDFNNAMIRGDRKSYFDENKIKELYNPKCLEYNYHVIKNRMKECGFELVTPDKGESYRQRAENGRVTYKSAIDHFAVKNIVLKDVRYLNTNLSDHSQLFGEIEFAASKETATPPVT
jgi:hypothetical protein